jgi:hypothetical protein
MYAARLLTVLFLILVIGVAYHPQAREAARQSWENARPAVVEVMDGLYAALRNLVAGTESHDGIDDSAPGENFDRIITMDHRGLI